MNFSQRKIQITHAFSLAVPAVPITFTHSWSADRHVRRRLTELLIFSAFSSSLESNTTLCVRKAHLVSTGDPVGLRRTDSTRTGSFELSVELTDVLWNLTTLLKVEALHIGHGLVDAADRRWIADGTLCAVTGAEMAAMDAADTYLAHDKLLSSL